MKYPGLLDEDVSRIGVQESQMLNLISGKLVTDLVKTSLGPKGMSKIYIDILDENTLTKHGGAFLRKVDVDHPAAKSVIEAVNTVDTHVGDGTTSSAILIGSLLDNAKDLLNMKIPVTVIIKGYERSLDYALDVLDDVKIRSNNLDHDIMKQLLITCLNGKTLFDLYDDTTKIINLMIEAISTIADFKNNYINIDDIKFEEKIGNISETQLIRGTILDKTIDSSAMPRSIDNPKILLINESLETMKTKSESEIEITSPEQMNQFLTQENTDLEILVKKIVDANVNVVISRKGVNEFVQEALAQKGIITIRRVKYNDLWWLEKATGAKTCKDIQKISADEIGHAKKIYEKTIGGDKMIFVEGINPKSITLLLRANSKQYLDELHRDALNGFKVLRNFIENPFIVFGAGSIEGIIAEKIRNHAPTIGNKEQIVLERFANSVEEIPLTLARNIGMDVIDTKTQLRAKFANSTNQIKWYGVDYTSRKISNMTLSKIIETAAVKQQVFNTAIEVTNMILNIDDVFMKNQIDNTHCHVDGHVHAHHDGGKSHNHFEQEGLEQRQMHQYY
jgi:chaperonin GroEL (HSP60 family)